MHGDVVILKSLLKSRNFSDESYRILLPDTKQTQITEI